MKQCSLDARNSSSDSGRRFGTDVGKGGANSYRRIAERGWTDGRDEVGIQSVHVAPFSHVSRFTRYSLWRWRTFSASC
jgi:hypothetical protein